MCDTVPNLYPDEIQKNDIGGNYDLTIKLEVDDPVERDRRMVAGRVLVESGMRSLRTFLMTDVGMSSEDADREIDEILAEKIMFQSPDIAAFMGFKAAEKSGMADELEQYKAMYGGNLPQVNTGSPYRTKGGQPRNQNIETELGGEMAESSNIGLGVRSTPAGY